MRRSVVSAAVLVALAGGATGCAGNSRSGTDQPGVAPPAASAGSAQRASITTSSEKDIQAALRANDVDDPERWSQVIGEARPYPTGTAGEQKLRDVLIRQGADPGTVDRIAATLAP